MKISISREKLLPPLQGISSVVERRQSLPILSNVLIESEAQHVSFTVTDLEIELELRIDHIARDWSSITVPARKLFDICRALEDKSEVEITVEEAHICVRSGRSYFKLNSSPAAEFPRIGELKARVRFRLPAKRLKELVEATHFAMAQQDVRYYLNGLLFELGGGQLRAVATDGHRLACSEIPVELEAPACASHADRGEQVQVILPRKGVLELGRMLSDSEDEVTVSVSENHMQMETGDRKLTSKLIDGRFPDYARVVPAQGDKQLRADREGLRQCLVRTSILSNEKFRGIRMHLVDNTLTSSTHNPEQEEAQERLEVEYEGAELEIGFNVSYLLDVLSAIKTDTVILELSDPDSGCLIRGGGASASKYVVMPMRL